jgi:hypothetical protein
MDSKKQTLVRWTILIVGGAITAAMLYGSGMRSKVHEVRAVTNDLKIMGQKYRDAQRDLRYRLTVSYQLEARRQLALALDEMEKRNFGVAQERLASTISLLETAQKAGTTAPDFSLLITKLKSVSLTATENIGEQRGAINDLAREMDTTLSGFVQEFLTSKKAEDDAEPIKRSSLNDVPLPPGNEIGRRSKPVTP